MPSISKPAPPQRILYRLLAVALCGVASVGYFMDKPGYALFLLAAWICAMGAKDVAFTEGVNRMIRLVLKHWRSGG